MRARRLSRSILLVAIPALAILIALAVPALVPGRVAAAGPPYPDPAAGQRVYDEAGALPPQAVARAEAMIRAIEERTGAQVAVYTQVKPGASTESAEQDAIALMDQWGIGRKGFDDGLVILFDLDQSLVHGQVQLYAGPGFRATFLTNQERQAIYENDMLPFLRDGDLGGALLIALERVDAAATPEHASALATAREVNAVIGLVGAPTAFLLLVGWALWSWRRFGKDPVYLDDPSIHMPAPPPKLTAATAALVEEGRVTRRALTTAMLDLASRDDLTFVEDKGLLRKKVSLALHPPNDADPRIALNRRAPLGEAEEWALDRLQQHAELDGEVSPEELLKFGTSVGSFNKKLEAHAVRAGWFAEAPAKASGRWYVRATIALVVGIAGLVAAFALPSDGLLLLGGGVVAAALVTYVVAYAMPARTMSGAMIRAWLAAYRRTLQKTLQGARSMEQVVASRAVPWLETPDQAVVWGVALGLHDEVEQVLERSMEDLRSGAPSSGLWFPIWYASSSGGSRGGGFGGLAPGLMASSAISNFGGMFAAIGTIGNTPSSSGGGGFGGGGSGGGGGGAGGGF